MSLRILHVDDDPDIREIVKFSLGLDPLFEVTSCAGGEEAIAISAGCEPDLILCDVMMPGMDGPAVLKRLRERPGTAKTPVLFMTARAQTEDIEKFKRLGAGVITKPFDPMKLADIVRNHLNAAKRDALGDEFSRRLRTDAEALRIFRHKLQSDPNSPVLLECILSCAHKLAGAAGVFGFPVVSSAASDLEGAVIDRRAGGDFTDGVEAKLDALLKCSDGESLTLPLAGDAPGLGRRQDYGAAHVLAGDGDDKHS
jgi:CheY-like chemotaxis protein